MMRYYQSRFQSEAKKMCGKDFAKIYFIAEKHQKAIREAQKLIRNIDGGYLPIQ